MYIDKYEIVSYSRKWNNGKQNKKAEITKIINGFNDYLAKINKEIDMVDHSLAIHYDYDIVPLPDDIIDKANEREK